MQPNRSISREHASRPAPDAHAPTPGARLSRSTVNQGVETLVRHVRALIRANPIETIHESPSRTILRVCQAVDFVIDRQVRKVILQSAPRTAPETAPEEATVAAAPDTFDLANPLAQHAWLACIAARVAFGFADREALMPCLGTIAQRASRELKGDPMLAEVNRDLAKALALHVGADLIDLAVRSRVQPVGGSVSVKHLNLVWAQRSAYERIQRENPRLLTALTAWLQNDESNAVCPWADAVPMMRADVLSRWLTPKAWRVLAAHGLEALVPLRADLEPWPAMIETLRALEAAHWPPVPPREFLRILHQVAGIPFDYDTAIHGVPGWFWRMACTEAAATGDAAEAYRHLCGRIPLWAWLVRTFELNPDNNQRRRCVQWLEGIVHTYQRQLEASDRPAWSLWLAEIEWQRITELKVVPLLSPWSLVEEAVALHNCADAFDGKCRALTHVLLSLRDPATNKRVAVACLEWIGNTWALAQLAGPCNRDVPARVRRVAQEVLRMVNGYSGEGAAELG